jgi:hypothetical protein
MWGGHPVRHTGGRSTRKVKAMGTRAIYTFEDATDERHIFVHYDGYPTGAATYFKQWLDAGVTWTIPRFEADEAAAGFVAAIKTGAGNVRIAGARFSYSDVEFGYRLFMRGDALHVQCATTDYWGDAPAEHIIFDGPMAEFIGHGPGDPDHGLRRRIKKRGRRAQGAQEKTGRAGRRAEKPCALLVCGVQIGQGIALYIRRIDT